MPIPQAIIPIQGQPVAGLGFSPDGRMLIVAMPDGSLSSFDTTTWRQSERIDLHQKSCERLAFSSTGTLLAAVGRRDERYYLKLFDTQKRELSDSLGPVEGSRVNAVAFSPGNKSLAIAVGLSAHIQVVRLLNLETKEEKAIFQGRAIRGFFPDINDLAFAPDGLLVIANETMVILFDTANNKEKMVLKHNAQPVEPVKRISLSPKGDKLAAGNTGPDVIVWEVATGKELAALHTRYVESDVRFSTKGNLLAVGFSGEAPKFPSWVTIWDSESWEELVTFQCHDEKFSHFAFSPNGELLATAGGWWNGEIKIWKVEQLLKRKLAN